MTGTRHGIIYYLEYAGRYFIVTLLCAARHIGDKPLVVLTAGVNSDEALISGLSATDFAAYQHTWMDVLQVRPAKLSRRGKQIIVEDSGHNIPAERPDAIVNAVREILSTAN